MDIHKRESKEIEAYEEAVGSGEPADSELIISTWSVNRYGNPCQEKKLPVDLLFKALGDVSGKLILDCGCGDGEFSTILGLIGGRVIGVDISKSLIATAGRRAKANGVSDTVSFIRASVHELPFPDETFDLVFGKGVIHHLDRRVSSEEIARVLKRGGSAVFEEPIAFSDFFQGLRKSAPIRKVIEENRITPDEEPLNRGDVGLFAAPFSVSEIHEVQMLSRLERIFGTGKIYDMLNAIDMRLFKAFPFLRKFGRLAIMVFRK